MLITDEHKRDGATKGMIGYIVEVYEDAHYEVEFSDASGSMIAQVVVSEKDLLSAPEPGFNNGKRVKDIS